MDFSAKFIQSQAEYATLEQAVAAPYFRKTFRVCAEVTSARLTIAVLGFYELYINGIRITKGFLSPYLSNPNGIVYCDSYDLQNYLQIGENVIGICLGNGFQNNFGGYIWDFDQADFRSAPRLALIMDVEFLHAEAVHLESDESFRTAPSPIYKDDYRNGEYYDARMEIPDWNKPGFDDSAWRFAMTAPAPKGEIRICEAQPIVVERKIAPLSVTANEEGYLYDFGENNAGLCHMEICAQAGQCISLYYAEHLKGGKLDRESVCLDENDYVQKDIYICKGGGLEQYMPSFTYHGFRYVLVKGLTPQQATKDLLRYVVLHTRLRQRGCFTCDNNLANAIFQMARRSDVSNFHHFPTDCPHREKNGWTGDAALSAEHMLLNLEPDDNFREWMRCICKAQKANGMLPGIIPTAGWGYSWGNGPAWDCVVVEIPYQMYRYRNDLSVAKESAMAIARYLDYLAAKVRADGLLCWGLGDWCPVGREQDAYQSPLEFTDTVIAMDLCKKAGVLFDALHLPQYKELALQLYYRLRKAGREHLIDTDTMVALGRCQTSQAMAIYYDLFEPEEKPKALHQLLSFIAQANDKIDVGVLGGRVLFHVLSAFGYSDLAYRMIVGPEYPSYGEWVQTGNTTLREKFTPNQIGSGNHHFWGDVSHWFIKWVAGIQYNADLSGTALDICPAFIAEMSSAEGWYEAPQGKIFVKWQREQDNIKMELRVPKGLYGKICLPEQYVFCDDDTSVRTLQSGTFYIK